MSDQQFLKLRYAGGLTAGGLEHVQSCHEPTPSRHALAHLSAGRLAPGRAEGLTGSHLIVGSMEWWSWPKFGRVWGSCVFLEEFHWASAILVEHDWIHAVKQVMTWIYHLGWGKSPICVCNNSFYLVLVDVQRMDVAKYLDTDGLLGFAGWRWCSAPTFTALAFLSPSFLFMLELTCPRRKRLRGWNTIYPCFWVGLVLVVGCGCWLVSIAVWNTYIVRVCRPESECPGTQTTYVMIIDSWLGKSIYIYYITVTVITYTYVVYNTI